MATTIQIPVELKKELDSLNDSNLSYAKFLKKLIENEKKRRNKLLLREYAQKYGEESLKEVKEWESTEIDWEY